MTVRGDGRGAVRADGVEVDRVGFPGGPERRSGGLVPADDLVLPVGRDALPTVEEHADPPDGHVRAAEHPGGRRVVRPDRSADRGLAGADVVGPVQLAHEVAGGVPVAPGRGALEAGVVPPGGKRPGRGASQDPVGVRDDHRVVRADLHDDVAVAARVDKAVPAEGREVGEGGGAGQREPVEQRAAESDRDGQTRRAGAGIEPWIGRRRAAGGQLAGSFGPALEDRGELLASGARQEVVGREQDVGLRGGRDPRLVQPVEGHGV